MKKPSLVCFTLILKYLSDLMHCEFNMYLKDLPTAYCTKYKRNLKKWENLVMKIITECQHIAYIYNFDFIKEQVRRDT